ncbi:MAG: response regulator transcription factor [Actinobacteria bacterium]|nr:response regulator transcription factor [Actinomycetota bacterium]MBU1943308.1 response regulator transcription factor [Actinomycetota bacterium]MBU2686574.1 response regulator transcription factor [Actinomycetota bacterium]
MRNPEVTAQASGVILLQVNFQVVRSVETRQEKVLVVDDEEHIVELVELYLGKEGYRVVSAYDGDAAIEKFGVEKPDLLVLDIMLPGRDGLDVLREIRKTSQVPVIMLTARESEVDKVVGLELGADDYLTKPFSPRELVARVKAVLRRVNPPVEEEPVISVGGLTLDTARRKVEVEGLGQVELTAREFDLLYVLAANPGIVLKRDRLMEKVWGYEYIGDTRTVDVYIRHLREKLDDDADNPRFIETVRGVGYRFKAG